MSAGTQSAARAADSKPVRLLGRVGLAGYGLVNLLLAWLAMQVALGAGRNEAEAGAGRCSASPRSLRARACSG